MDIVDVLKRYGAALNADEDEVPPTTTAEDDGCGSGGSASSEKKSTKEEESAPNNTSKDDQVLCLTRLNWCICDSLGLIGTYQNVSLTFNRNYFQQYSYIAQ